MKHELKILPKYFVELQSGKKTFELRKDDRPYKEGDALLLREWWNEAYTGREELRSVSYVLRNCPEYGLMEGYCILGITK